jgi:cysteine desulfurase
VFEDVTYLDNAAATRLDERVLEAMKPYFFDLYAVATSQFGYSLGIEATDALDGARTRIADRIGAQPDEVIFTSGGTEASNLALKGAARAVDKGRDHVVKEIRGEIRLLARTIAAIAEEGEQERQY